MPGQFYVAEPGAQLWAEHFSAQPKSPARVLGAGWIDVVEEFGFVPDGRTDNYAAFQRLAAAASMGQIPTIDPAGILGVFFMVAPVAMLFAAVLLTISLFAKSYKEAQSYVSPLIVVVVMPAMMGMLPGIELSAKTALVPIMNLSLVCKEMLSGVWHWNYIALIFGSTCVYAAIALGLAVKMFNREDVIFRA